MGGSLSGVASLVGELPGEGAPAAEVLEVPAGTGFDTVRPDEAADVPEATDSTPRSATPQVSAPAPEGSSGLSEDVTTPALAPATGAAQSALAQPSAGVAASGVEVAGEDPVLPNPQSLAPEIPVNEADVSISTDPAQPALPDVGAQSAFAEAQAEPSDDLAASEEALEPAPQVAVEVAQPQAPGAQGEAETAGAAAPAPQAPQTEVAQTEVAETQAPQTELAEARVAEPDAAEDAPSAQDAPEVEPAPQTPVAETAAVEPDATETAEAPAEAPVQEDLAALQPAPDPAPAVGLTNRAPEVVTNRLPSIGGENAAAPAPKRPIEAFAADFANAEQKPLFSIVLHAGEDATTSLAALQNFQGALTIAVDASQGDAKEVMQAAREAGYEVVAVADVPQGARPSDIEVAFETYLTNVPEAVAILDGTGNGFRGDRRVATQVVERLSDSGHGLVTFDAGLNTAAQLARRDGVPVKTVFRDIDANDQSAAVIRRFLDQAAFRAAQEKGVVMLGRLRAETISALLIWEQQTRAQSVSLAPVSAILLAE